MNKFDLLGKTALITGAAGLLGREHAYSLLENGATVVLTDMSPAALDATVRALREHHDPQRVLAAVMDVTDPVEIEGVAQSLVRDGLRVDILINNAAIDPKVKGEQGVVETSRLENFPLAQ